MRCVDFPTHPIHLSFVQTMLWFVEQFLGNKLAIYVYLYFSIGNGQLTEPALC